MSPIGFRSGQCSRKGRFLRMRNLAYERVAGRTDMANKSDLVLHVDAHMQRKSRNLYTFGGNRKFARRTCSTISSATRKRASNSSRRRSGPPILQRPDSSMNSPEADCFSGSAIVAITTSISGWLPWSWIVNQWRGEQIEDNGFFPQIPEFRNRGINRLNLYPVTTQADDMLSAHGRSGRLVKVPRTARQMAG